MLKSRKAKSVGASRGPAMTWTSLVGEAKEQNSAQGLAGKVCGISLPGEFAGESRVNGCLVVSALLMLAGRRKRIARRPAAGQTAAALGREELSILELGIVLSPGLVESCG